MIHYKVKRSGEKSERDYYLLIRSGKCPVLTMKRGDWLERRELSLDYGKHLSLY